MKEQTAQKLNSIIRDGNKSTVIASKHFTNDEYNTYIMPLIELSNNAIELVKEVNAELETKQKENEVLRNNMLKSNEILSNKDAELIKVNIELEKLRKEISK